MGLRLMGRKPLVFIGSIVMEPHLPFRLWIVILRDGVLRSIMLGFSSRVLGGLRWHQRKRGDAEYDDNSRNYLHKSLHADQQHDNQQD